MGLTIAKGIVDAHEWELKLTASADSGARFEVSGWTITVTGTVS